MSHHEPGDSPNEPVDQPGCATAEDQTDAERLQLVADPRPDRLGGQLVAAFEQESAVEGDREAADFVQQGQQDNVEEDGGAGVPGSRHDAGGKRASAVSRIEALRPVASRPPRSSTPQRSEMTLA